MYACMHVYTRAHTYVCVCAYTYASYIWIHTDVHTAHRILCAHTHTRSGRFIISNLFIISIFLFINSIFFFEHTRYSRAPRGVVSLYGSTTTSTRELCLYIVMYIIHSKYIVCTVIFIYSKYTVNTVPPPQALASCVYI